MLFELNVGLKPAHGQKPIGQNPIGQKLTWTKAHRGRSKAHTAT